MGLISDGTNYTVLTDIQGLEDHFGDMDFKVAGTRQGITALQMDIKISGITPAILEEALAQAKVARLRFLMLLSQQSLSHVQSWLQQRLRSTVLRFPVDKIKVVIGKVAKQLTRLSLRLVSLLISMKKVLFRFSLVIRMPLTVLKLSSPILYVKLRLRGLHCTSCAY